MPNSIPGVHHVTAIGSDPARNLGFYTETLGLRLVKRSVNQDDTSVYHFFYADHDGSPGTSMTFFPYPGARSGRVGAGQVSTTAFLIPAASVDYWTDRLAEAGVDADEPIERFGDTLIAFEDPDGLALELVAREDAPAGNLPESPVPEEHAIRGFFGVTLALDRAGPIADLLAEMGFTEAGEDGDRTRYLADGDLGYAVDVRKDPEIARGHPGAGTVHHVAFRVTRETQEEWRQALIDDGLRPSGIVDRKWFESVYVRTPGGILFEFATEKPGYAVDESLDSLGERLVLPERLVDRRESIEAGLPDLSIP